MEIRFHHESMERYIWGLGATILVLVVAFSIFCKRSWKRVGLTAHQGMPREEPPPYRSIELTTLNSNNSSVEMLAEDDHVLRVGQTKESPVQAVPFRQPDYITPQEYPDFDTQDSITDELELELEPYVNGNEHNAPIVDLLDDNTMPSDWTPQQNGEQMEVEEAESSDDADACEHSSNRHKSDAGANDENYSGLLNINLLINNNITINKH